MTTFEGIIYALIHGVTEFLPIGANAHHMLVPHLFGFAQPQGAMLGALSLGAFLALLIYFRHDWASMISSVLQTIIYRRYPTSLDERLPIFITLALLPSLAAWFYLSETVHAYFDNPARIAASLAAFGVLLGIADAWGRKNKGTYDWNWLDSLVVGFFQALMIVPGCGPVTGALLAGLLRNYRREAAAKFTFFTCTPLLGVAAFSHLRDVSFSAPAPMAGTSWMTFSVALVISLLTGLLVLSGFMKQMQRRGFKAYIVYRLLVGIGVLVWLYTHGGV